MSHREIKIPFSDAPWGTCRWCGKVIVKKDGTQNLRRRWHPECSGEFDIQIRPRLHLSRTEQGVCQACGLETRGLARELNKQGWEYGYRPWSPLGERLGKQGFDVQRSLWDVDHVVPLKDGGGFGREWIWTLCQVCHKIKTGLEAGLRPKGDYIRIELGLDPTEPDTMKMFWQGYLAERRADG